MKEEWRQLEWGPVLVSSEGRVAKIRKPWVGPLGYCRCHTIEFDGTKRATYAHQLVAEAFLGPCPEGCEIHHRNGDKSDNRASNLEYVTRKDHVRISVQSGQHPQGEGHYASKLTPDDVRDIRRRYKKYKVTRKMLGEEYGVHPGTIQCILERKSWKHVT